MIDIHSHILPGLDDGAPDLKTAIKMAKVAVKDGVTTMIATPHCLDGVFNCQKESILSCCTHFNKVLENQRVPLRVYPGAENHLSSEFLNTFNKNKMLTLADAGNAVLVELPQRFIPEAVIRVMEKLKEKRLTTIIAHPERNQAIRRHPEIVKELVKSGAMMQVTADSLVGNFGSPTKIFAEQLVTERNIHFIGSDCHSYRKRSPKLQKAYSKLRKIGGKDLVRKMHRDCKKLFYNDRLAISININ